MSDKFAREGFAGQTATQVELTCIPALFLRGGYLAFSNKNFFVAVTT
jgi:hypothetical protein